MFLYTVEVDLGIDYCEYNSFVVVAKDEEEVFDKWKTGELDLPRYGYMYHHDQDVYSKHPHRLRIDKLGRAEKKFKEFTVIIGEGYYEG